MVTCLVLYIGASRLLFGSSRELEFVSSCVAYPFLVMQKTVIRPLSDAWHNYKSRNSLQELLAHYTYYTQQLQARVIELEALNNYAGATQELVAFARRYKNPQAVSAQVLLRNFDAQNHFFIIDVGSLHAITPDMVVVHKNCLVGRVTHVYRYYSKVLLITDKTCKIAAYCAATGAQGIHEGTTSLLSTSLTFVNHLEKLQQGDLIVSSGEGLIFPCGFALGRLKKFEPDGFNYTITVEPLIDFKTIAYCSVIQKGSEYMLPLSAKPELQSSSDSPDVGTQK
jgi:rod shape-determining protein MreC